MYRLLSFSGERRKSKRAPLAVLAAIAGLSVSVAQAEPIALILDKSEAVPYPAFSELAPGDTVDLGQAGYIELLDYSSCREVRITSGTVSVGQSGFTVKGGEEKELRAGNCLQADSGNGQSETTGLTVTLRGIANANKLAASLMLRFDDAIRSRFDTVFVSFAGGPPKRFKVGDNVLADMPKRDNEADAVDVELYLQGKAPDFGVEMRKITIDPSAVGRKTAVIVVQ